MSSGDYLLLHFLKGYEFVSKGRHKIQVTFLGEKQKSHFVDCQQSMVFNKSFCFKCPLSELQTGKVMVHLMNDKGFAHHPKIVASYEFKLSSLLDNPSWGPFTITLLNRKSTAYGRIGLKVQFVAYETFFNTPNLVDIDAPLFFVATVHGASLAKQKYLDKGVYLELYSGDTLLGRTDTCNDLDSWNGRIIVPTESIYPQLPFVFAMYYGHDNYIGECEASTDTIFTVEEVTYEFNMKGYSCQENVIEVSCMLVYNESILCSGSYEGIEEENNSDVIPQDVPLLSQSSVQIVSAQPVITSQTLPSSQSYRSESGVSHTTVEQLPLQSNQSQSPFIPLQPTEDNMMPPNESEQQIVAVPVELTGSIQPPVPELPSTLPSIGTLPNVGTGVFVNAVPKVEPSDQQTSSEPIPIVSVQPIPQSTQSGSPNKMVTPVTTSNPVPMMRQPHSAQSGVTPVQPHNGSPLQVQPISPPVVQVVLPGNSSNHSPVTLTGATSSPLPRVLPSCFTIDAVTDDTFRDEYDDATILAMDPESAPALKPIVISIPEDTPGEFSNPSVVNSSTKNDTVSGSVRQDGVTRNEPSTTFQTAPNVIRNSFMKDFPSVPTHGPRTEERVALTQSDIDFFNTLEMDEL